MDYSEIKAEYIAGGTSYRKLAEKHGVPFDTLRKVAAKEHWKELKDKASAEAATKIVKMQANRQAERMKRLLAVSDKLLVAVENAVDKFDAGELLLDKGALKSLSGAIRDIQAIQNIKSELDIEEQKARIAILKKQAEADSQVDKDITVTIVGDLDDYSK